MQVPAGIELAKSVDILWVVLSAALVFFMQAGFLMLETGLTRLKNSINVAVKNLIDYTLGSLCFFLVGFGLMFGLSYEGYWGTSLFGLAGLSTGKEYAFFLFQVAFMGTAATIVSGAVAERIKFNAYIWISLLISALIYPIFGHWAWGGGFLTEMGFVDFAGSTVVHSLGGWVALAGIIALGARKHKFDSDGKPHKISGNNLPNAVLGTFILWFGWFGFNGGSTLALNEDVPLIVVNTCIAASAGGVFALLISWALFPVPAVEDCINGVIGGLVAITAGCHAVNPIGAFAIGALAGAVAIGTAWIMEHFFKLDDVIGAFPVHGACGILGTLFLPFFVREGVEISFATQAIGVAVCGVWAFGVGYLGFWLLKITRGIRVTEEEEEVGLNVSEHGAKSTWLDLIDSMKEFSKMQGDLTKVIKAEPGSEAGAIAHLINIFMGNLAQLVYEIKVQSNSVRESSKALLYAFDSIHKNIVNGSAQLQENAKLLKWTQDAILEIQEKINFQDKLGKEDFILLGSLTEDNRYFFGNLENSFLLAEKSQRQATDGNRSLGGTIQGMSQIKNSSSKVGTLVNTLAEISSRLHLLSINASIEAARAGEHGLGFSIVATEISKLSTMAEQNTKQAKVYLQEITSSVEQGEVSLTETASYFESISAHVQEINGTLQDLNKSIPSQRQRLEQVSENVRIKMDDRKKIKDILSLRAGELEVITESMMDVSKAMTQISHETEELQIQGKSFLMMSKILKSLVEQFKTSGEEDQSYLQLQGT